MSEPIRNLSDAVREQGAVPVPVVPEAEAPDALTATFAPTQVLREDVYESPLHHEYQTPHDMPETGGERRG